MWKKSVYYTSSIIYHDDATYLKNGIEFIFTIRKNGNSKCLYIFDCYVDFVLKYIEKLSMKVERVIEKKD